VAACFGRRRALPQRAALRKAQKPELPFGLQIIQQNLKFSWARLFQERGSSQPPPGTESHNFTFGVAAVFAGPPYSVAAFEVNTEPHTGARPSVRLCVGLIMFFNFDINTFNFNVEIGSQTIFFEISYL
jgi:hypothetical protein